MQNEDKAKFLMLMTAITELHQKKLSKQLLDIYWNALKHFEFKDVQLAMNRLILDPDVGQFMPKPADIARYIDGDSETRALNAWGKVMCAVRQVGAWDSVIFDDPIIHIVLTEMGGWVSLCRKQESELSFIFKEFEKRYRKCLIKRPTAYPERLRGKLEQNSASGSCYQSPILCADQDFKYLNRNNKKARIIEAK